MILAVIGARALPDTTITITSGHSLIAPGILQLFATIAAAVAAFSAWRSTANALRFKRADKQAGYYDKYVSDPMRAALEDAKAKIVPLISPGVTDIAKLCSTDASQKAVATRVKKLTEDIQTALLSLKDTVGTTIGAWPDQACNSALRESLENIEDDLVKESEKLVLDQAKPDVRKVLLDRIAKFHVVLMNHDASLQALGGVLPKRAKGRKGS